MSPSNTGATRTGYCRKQTRSRSFHESIGHHPFISTSAAQPRVFKTMAAQPTISRIGGAVLAHHALLGYLEKRLRLHKPSQCAGQHTRACSTERMHAIKRPWRRSPRINARPVLQPYHALQLVAGAEPWSCSAWKDTTAESNCTTNCTENATFDATIERTVPPQQRNTSHPVGFV